MEKLSVDEMEGFSRIKNSSKFCDRAFGGVGKGTGDEGTGVPGGGRFVQMWAELAKLENVGLG
jgi:hypothetical protein